MKTAINTRTQEEYDALREYILATKGRYIFADWGKYREHTCVNPETLSCANPIFYKQLGISIIPYTEFAKANIVEEKRCELGCKIFTGGEIKHHKDCAYYPESMSQMLDDYKALYLEGRELLEKVCDAYTPETNEQDELEHKIGLYLTKHNVTPNN